jgi:PAS domain S-box-containing protein
MNDVWCNDAGTPGGTPLEMFSDAVVTTDAEGVILQVNSAAERLIGRSAGRVVGTRAPYAFWSTEDAPRLSDFIESRRSHSDGPAEIETHYLHASGVRVPVRLTLCVCSSHTLHVATPRLDTGTLPSRDLMANRIGALEQGLRNIAWELRALGTEAGASAGTGPVPAETIRQLSTRQREVLDAFMAGHSVAATAARLHLSEHTVRSHLKVIYRKTGVRSGTELMRLLTSNPEPEALRGDTRTTLG